MKIVRRILIGIGIGAVTLVVLIAGSILVDGLLGGGRLDAVTNTRISNSTGPDVRAYVARPSTPGPHPAVILVHEFWGLNGDLVGKAEALALEGYVVVAPDVFRGSTTGWVPSGVYQVITTPQSQIMGDLDAVFAWLSSQPDVQPDRIAIMGFCFGGGASLQYSLRNSKLAGTVILYGMLVADVDRLRALPGPVLGIFGGADQSIPASQVQAFESALNDAGVPNHISIYAGQPHAFVTFEGISQGGPPGQAWSEVLDFLRQTLQTGGSVRREVTPLRLAVGTDWGYLFALAYEHTLGPGAHTH
jgi:carboxymethylenebutenolidase